MRPRVLHMIEVKDKSEDINIRKELIQFLMSDISILFKSIQITLTGFNLMTLLLRASSIELVKTVIFLKHLDPI